MAQTMPAFNYVGLSRSMLCRVMPCDAIKSANQAYQVQTEQPRVGWVFLIASFTSMISTGVCHWFQQAHKLARYWFDNTAPSHRTSSLHVHPNSLKLCTNFMNVVQTSWTGYKLHGWARTFRTFEPAQSFLPAIPFWARSDKHSEN